LVETDNVLINCMSTWR